MNHKKAGRRLTVVILACLLLAHLPARPAAAQDNPAPTIPPDTPPVDVLVDYLSSVPVLPDHLSDRARDIYARGQAKGMRADVFSKVGDCHATNEYHLAPIGAGDYDLGPYTDLQATIDYYSRTAPRPGQTDSFSNPSLTTWGGATAVGVLDPTWANQEHCRPGEAPLFCEYRLVRPGVSIIMLGLIDAIHFDAETFEAHLREVVEASIARGILPVLTTYPNSPEDWSWQKVLHFNAITLQIAEAHELPVINLWLATRALPDFGLAGDHWHLQHTPGRLDFGGDADEGGGIVYAATLRDLLTLQMLDLLRRELH